MGLSPFQYGIVQVGPIPEISPSLSYIPKDPFSCSGLIA